MYAATLAEMDEGMQVLDQRDHDEVKSEKKDHVNKTTAREAFAKTYFAKKEASRKAALKGQKRQKKGAAAATTTLPSTIAQSCARQYIPAGTSIWRSTTRGAWCGHCPPRKRISEPWSRFEDGDQGALQAILRRMWRQHAELEGIREADLPFNLD